MTLNSLPVLRNRLYYYGIKPLVPRSARLAVRRWFAVRKRELVNVCWPIMPGSERAPEIWPGWPDGKRFALVLTHDVEGQAGLDKCRQVMELEQQMGFRSSFNFIPANGASVSPDLRAEVARNGFEVGVHDLHHDGKLFLTERQFHRNAPEINKYLRDWGAVGFRSAFMLHNLGWLHQLDIQYDLSTFDTDPFEPQPQGHHTIFPFWVPGQDTPTPGPQNNGTVVSRPAAARGGYVELPYTLPQDSTLFLLLRERHPDLWFQKLDWIAAYGGMALVNVHPDYMRFNGEPLSAHTYPAECYIRFLEYVRRRYGDSVWQPLPRELSNFVRGTCEQCEERHGGCCPRIARPQKRKAKIWIDLDNTPHVPFFEPILDELNARGFPLLVTARDAFQVCDLADQKRLSYVKIGRHYGKHRLMKGFGLGYRAAQLAPLVLRERPALGVSHGARSQLLLANALRISSLLIADYEYCQFPPMMRPTWLMTPSVIPDSALRLKNGHLRKYPGIKEDVYAWKLEPDPSALRGLGIRESDIVITVRPPATEAHYHNPASEKLFEAFMERACQVPDCRIVLLPRNKKQGADIRSHWPRWFDHNKTVIPNGALEGLNLIWHSDLVVSGGGTMNREAAALGVPVYSIFRGTIGAVDRHLQSEHRLVLVESVADVRDKIAIARKPHRSLAESTSNRTLQYIADTIEQITEQLASKFRYSWNLF